MSGWSLSNALELSSSLIINRDYINFIILLKNNSVHLCMQLDDFPHFFKIIFVRHDLKLIVDWLCTFPTVLSVKFCMFVFLCSGFE